MTIVSDILPAAKRGEGMGYFSMTMPLAMVVGPALGVTLLDKFGNYTVIFNICTVLGVAGLFMAMALKLPAKKQRQRIPFKFRISAIYEKRAYGLSFMQFCYSFTYAGLATFIPLFAHKFNVGSPGFFFLVYAIGVLLSRVMVRKSFDLRGPTPLIVTGYVMFALGFLMLAFTTTHFFFFFAAVVVGFGAGMIMPTIATMNMNIVSANSRGKANATLFTAIDIGMGTGALLLGYLIQHTSYRATFIIEALILILPIAWFFLIEKNRYFRYINQNGL
jgi:predicted MFS family arabinose efflux permease